jgi:ABC-type sugar transport system ATPase subunit
LRLEGRDLSKSFGAVAALSGVNFSIDAGEIRGLCGENGAGKSTLVKILTGVYQPDQGSVMIDGVSLDALNPHLAQEAGIAFVSQELSIPPHLSVFDNIWLGHRAVPLLHRRSALRKRAVNVLQLVGIDYLDLDLPASALSMAERQLLEIARAIIRDAQILFLDEPTATLSNHEIERVFATLRRLRQQGTSIVFITHRLAEVFELCDTVTVLRNGAIVASRHIRDATREHLIELMLGYTPALMYPKRATAQQEIALSVHSLKIPGTLSGLSIDLARGEIMCLAGQIGSGASDAVRALAGLIYYAEGDVRRRGTRLSLRSVSNSMAAGLMFVSEDRAAEGIFLKLGVLDNLVALWLNRGRQWSLLHRRELYSLASRVAETVGIDRRRLASRASDLSGGNQQKVSIGRATIATENAVLLMNEPTRGVDVGARVEIYRLMRELCERGFSILMASTDLEEIAGISDVVVTMFRGTAVASYRGTEISRSRILADIVNQERDAVGAMS